MVYFLLQIVENSLNDGTSLQPILADSIISYFIMDYVY